MTAFLMTAGAAQALTLSELRSDSKLTPKRFARYFSDFEFRFHAEVQPAEVFLATQSGDCDDFAVLAARVLGEKGYVTRLISVRMDAGVHVVCYVEDTRCYLDFNNRGYMMRTTKSDGSMKDIARKVAKSFDSDWTTVSEFQFEFGSKRLVSAVSNAAYRPVLLTSTR